MTKKKRKMTDKIIRIQRKIFSAKCRIEKELDKLMLDCEELNPSKAMIDENESLKNQVKELTGKLNSINHSAKMRTHTKQEVLEALERHDGVRELASDELQIPLFTLYGAIRRFGITYPARRRKKIVEGKVVWELKNKYK